MTKGLALKTCSIIESVSKMDCIKPYLLTGGTALSLQINHRLSEDFLGNHRYGILKII